MSEFQLHNEVENKSGVETAKRILSRTLYRPEPNEVRALTVNDINAAAEQLSYPVYNLSKYETFHTQALPLIAEKARILLEENEERKPTYIIFGRDGDMMYDTMASVTSGTEIAQRVHLINIGRAHAEQVEQGPEHTQEYQEHMKAYLQENDISSETLQTGNFVFLDSGYRGSMFDFALQMGGNSREAMGDRMKGYLLLRGEMGETEASPYAEIGWPAGTTVDERFFTEFYDKFAKNWEDSGTWGPNIMIPHLNTERKVNWALANYLQVQPKYTRPGFDVEQIDGKWRSIPNLTNRGYPIKNLHLWEIRDVTQPVRHPNSCVVDPVAALKLQNTTANYFTRPEVRSAVLKNTLHN